MLPFGYNELVASARAYLASGASLNEARFLLVSLPSKNGTLPLKLTCASCLFNGDGGHCSQSVKDPE